MSCPQTINEVFNTERYAPFVRFCQSRGMVTMADLVRCPFEQLENEANGFSSHVPTAGEMEALRDIIRAHGILCK